MLFSGDLSERSKSIELNAEDSAAPGQLVADGNIPQNWFAMESAKRPISNAVVTRWHTTPDCPSPRQPPRIAARRTSPLGLEMAGQWPERDGAENPGIA